MNHLVRVAPRRPGKGRGKRAPVVQNTNFESDEGASWGTIRFEPGLNNTGCGRYSASRPLLLDSAPLHLVRILGRAQCISNSYSMPSVELGLQY